MRISPCRRVDADIPSASRLSWALEPCHFLLPAKPPVLTRSLWRGGRDGRKNEKGTGYRMLHEKGIIQMERKWPNGSERPGKEERKGKKKKKEEFVFACAAFHPSLKSLSPPPTPPSTLDLSTH